ncbi:zinc finger protein on ecdysone puffs isoform X2 [Eurosta solidaginis]|uniref:zinc finger protein on ecdysone puffs isoform X2 n=1 Tax=Eurosta solidaginis TaxID=178769 RepID=UPI0035310518
MAFRGNQNRNRNFGGNNYGGPMGANRMNMNMSPWDTPNTGNFGNMRQGGGQGMNAQAINLANNLLNNLFRNQNPPSLLDLPRGGGGGMGNRNQRSGPNVDFLCEQLESTFRGLFLRNDGLLSLDRNVPHSQSQSQRQNKKSKESPYASVPNDMFYCHLCKKHMWDANSFENHIKGRTHLMMREGIEESYRLKANMIRQEAKIAEQLKSIELDRLKRMGKSKQRQLEYCTMCDLNFHGHISAHRKSEGHLSLKKFLHPKCVECNKEFATRIDYDTHLLSADHLQKAAEKNTKVGERKRPTLTIHTEEEESKDLRPPQKKRKKPAAKKAEGAEGEIKKEGEDGAEGEEAEGEDAEKKEGEEGADETKEGEDLNETQEEEEVALPVDPEDCIIDFAEGDEIPTEVDNRLPKYNWTRPVGAGLITKLECFECSLCGKFLDTEKTVEVHSRTVTHHRNFLKFINEKASDTKIAQKRAAAAQEESERKKRKLEEAEAAATATEVKTENGEGGEGAEGDLYDPSEATGEGEEDVEMNENGEAAEGEEGGEEEAGDESMEANEAEQEAEAAPEPEPVKEQPKAETPAKTPAKAAATTPAAATPAGDTSPSKKATPARATPKATTRGGRGRGRYNRY